MPISDANSETDGALSKSFAPRLSAKEQENALAAFYLDPVFRNSLKLLKSMVPLSVSLRDPGVKRVFLSRVRLVLSRWGLHKFPHHASSNYKWIAWLWRHWDPDSGVRPILPVSIREPQLAHWTIRYLEAPLNFSDDVSVHRTFRNSWVTVTFFPGISHTQAMKAARVASDLANRPMKGVTITQLKGGRPGATAAEIKALFGVFDRVGLPGNTQGQRSADKLRSIRKAIEDSSAKSVNSLKYWSDSIIANLYRNWRASKGAPPRRYYKDPARR